MARASRVDKAARVAREARVARVAREARVAKAARVASYQLIEKLHMYRFSRMNSRWSSFSGLVLLIMNSTNSEEIFTMIAILFIIFWFSLLSVHLLLLRVSAPEVALHVSVIAVLLLCPLHPPLHHHTTVAAYRLGVVTWGEGSLIVQCCHVHHYHN